MAGKKGRSGRKRIMTDLQLEVAREIVATGEASFREVAQVYGCSPQAIRHYCPGLRQPSVSLADVERIRALRLLGRTIEYIAHAVELSKSTVIGVCQRRKIKANIVPTVYPPELKANILRETEIESCVAVARKYKMPLNTIYQWRWQAGLAHKPTGGKARQFTFGAY